MASLPDYPIPSSAITPVVLAPHLEASKHAEPTRKPGNNNAHEPGCQLQQQAVVMVTPALWTPYGLIVQNICSLLKLGTGRVEVDLMLDWKGGLISPAPKESYSLPIIGRFLQY